MKKMSFVFTFLVLGALLLAACGGSGANNESGTPGAVGTVGVGTAAPGMDLTGTPGTGTELGTPTVGAGAGSDLTTGTPAAGTGATSEATVMPTTGAAGGATAEPTTGTGSVPATGAGGQFVLLSDLMKMNINGKDGTQVGSVAGVVVDRGAGSASTSGSTTGTAVPTTSAGSTTGTALPTTSAGGTSGATAMGAGPRVSYLLVNVNGGASSTSGSSAAGSTTATAAPTMSAGSDSSGSGTGTGTTGSSASGASGSQVLVPWQAFSVSGASTSMGSTSGSTTGTAVPTTSAGSTTGTAVPTTSAGGTSGSTAMGSQALTLTVDSSVLASAPAFDASAFNGSVSSDVTAYWSGQNLSIPATGASASAANSSVLIRGQIGSLSIKDQAGQSLGQVRDFVVDTTTGDIVYAILGGGSSSSGSMYVVPIKAMNWQPGTGASATDLGTFSATFDASRLSSAPSITSMSGLDLSSSTWHSDVDSFWNTTP